MGPLGLKKAEQDLIKRRYKQYQYGGSHEPLQTSSLARLAQVYGSSQPNKDLNKISYAQPYQHSSSQNHLPQAYDYNQHTYNSVGQPPSDQQHATGVSVQKSPSPYLKYSRDIQNLYKRYR